MRRNARSRPWRNASRRSRPGCRHSVLTAPKAQSAPAPAPRREALWHRAAPPCHHPSEPRPPAEAYGGADHAAPGANLISAGRNDCDDRLFAGSSPIFTASQGETMRILISASALMLAAFTAQPGWAQSGPGRYCLTDLAGASQCIFNTMAECELARPSGLEMQCLDRTIVQGTVGSGSSAAPSPPSPPPSSGAAPTTGDGDQR